MNLYFIIHEYKITQISAEYPKNTRKHPKPKITGPAATYFGELSSGKKYAKNVPSIKETHRYRG